MPYDATPCGPDLDSTERSALVRVRDALRSGLIPASGFSMSYFEQGSCHCIGGWMAIYMGIEHSAVSRAQLYNDPRFTDLFAVGQYGSSPVFVANRREAAEAIDNFLVSGNPQWGKVLGCEILSPTKEELAVTRRRIAEFPQMFLEQEQRAVAYWRQVNVMPTNFYIPIPAAYGDSLALSALVAL